MSATQGASGIAKAPARWSVGLPKFRAGSMLWLLMHECRMFFYELGGSKSGKKLGRRIPVVGVVTFLVLFCFIHFIAWLVMRSLPPLSGEPSAMLLMGSGAALVLVSSFMLSLALNRSVTALFERGDLDLLLSSPLSAQTIFGVRLAGIVVGVATLFLFFLTPFAHVGLVLGQWRWLGIYPTLISLAMIASSVAMLLTLGLVKLLGVRRSLVAAQLIGALSGAAIFLLTQLFGNVGAEVRQQTLKTVLPWLKPGGPIGPESLVWMPARALFGEPAETLGFAVIGMLVFYLTARFTRRFFVLGVQQAGDMSDKTNAANRHAQSVQKGQARAARFRTGLRRNIMIKEWRLIMRDPTLISQIFLQLLYLLPMFFVILRGNVLLPGVAAAITFLAASLAGSLIWIIVSAEDAPDLLRSAPASLSQIRQGKLAAAVLPVVALLLPVLGWLMLRAPLLAVLMLLASGLAMASASQIHLWHAKPAARSQFKRRGQGQLLAGMLEFLSNAAWAASVFATMMFGWWSLLPISLALLILGFARLTRARTV